MSDFTKSKISGHDNHATPAGLYAQLDTEFHFNDDPCPLHGELKEDGLSREWGSRVFFNPPYSNPTPWVKKAYDSACQGSLVVGLLRGDTSTMWFHNWVLPYAELRFIRGRLNFGPGPAPFPSIIAIWRPRFYRKEW